MSPCSHYMGMMVPHRWRKAQSWNFLTGWFFHCFSESGWMLLCLRQHTTLVWHEWVQIYGKHFSSTLRADPGVKVVTLHDKSPYYEEFGTRFALEWVWFASVIACTAREMRSCTEWWWARSDSAIVKSWISHKTLLKRTLLVSLKAWPNLNEQVLMPITWSKKRAVFQVGQKASSNFIKWKHRDLGGIGLAVYNRKRRRESD